jgi:tryptophan-rich sensory protein
MKYVQILVSILIAQMAGFIGSVFTVGSIGNWYMFINKPSWNPPSFIFGPVWVTLYTLMGLSSYLVWRERKTKKVTVPLLFYLAQLLLNASWSIVFFGMNNIGLAFINIIILLILILITLIKFWKINKWAGILLIPYLLWVGFASVLNYTIWTLN